MPDGVREEGEKQRTSLSTGGQLPHLIDIPAINDQGGMEARAVEKQMVDEMPSIDAHGVLAEERPQAMNVIIHTRHRRQAYDQT